VAAVDKHERTQRGTVLGAIGGHGDLQKERLDFGIFWGSLAEARRTSEQKESTRATITVSIQISVGVQFPDYRMLLAPRRKKNIVCN